jgi:hypothetical protein
MEFGQVNYLAVLAAAVVSFAVGPLWYGPLFGKQWMALTGISEESAAEAGMKPLIFTFIGFLFLAYAIARIMSFGMMTGIAMGLMVAVLAWLLIMAPLMLSQTLYQGQPVKLFVIDSSFRLVTTLIMGIILGLWS